MVYRCTGCDDTVDPPRPRCSTCGGVPIYRADRAELERAIAGEPMGACPPVDSAVSMGEGGTPCVRLSGPGGDTFGKLESANPTCSFKDRGSAVLVSAVIDPDTPMEAVAVASTGNTASSVAAYAARAGVPCAILVPAASGAAKLGQAAVHGASVSPVEGSFSECFQGARTLAEDERIANATAVYSANPYVASANRVVAFEILHQLGEVPDWVAIPVGAGPLLGGIHAGFADLANAGLIKRVPKLCAVQAQGCHPIVRAFETDRPVESWTDPIDTRVGAIADPLRGYADDGEYTRQAVLASGGTAIALPDEVVFSWRDRLAAADGVFVEPASAASVAALAESPAIRANETAVAVLTGHGLKEAPEFSMETVDVTDIDDIRRRLLA